MKILDSAALSAGAILVLPPLASILASGLAAIASLARPDVLEAVITSFAIAIPAAAIALLLALGIASTARRLRSARRPRSAAALSLPAGLILAVPPVAVSAGLFVVLRPVADPFGLAIPLIVLVNALTALPFALTQIEPPLTLSAERYGRVAESLGVSGLWRIKLVDWPLLRRPFLAAFAVATALSLGDLGVTAFFGSGEIRTLPLLLYQRMGTYRLAESAAIALLLASLVLALFLAAQRWSGEALARSR